MDHIAIMKKSWHLLDKILSGEKTIESRWYVTKHLPWNKITAGDIVYFKNSGELVSLKAVVEKVLQFSNLTSNKVKEILDLYHLQIGISESKIPEFFDLFKDKKYCILIFLKNVEKIAGFEINKQGFGAMSAWLCVDDVDKIVEEN